MDGASRFGDRLDMGYENIKEKLRITARVVQVKEYSYVCCDAEGVAYFSRS